MAVYPSRENIEAARDAAVAALTAALTSPKPTYDIDGQKISWNEYRKQLQESIDWATDMLAKIDASESGPGCEETTCVT